VTTAAILAIGRNESPFFEEWAEHHFGLGFDRLYYVSTDDDPGAAERSVEASRFRSRIELRHFDDFRHGWQMRCYFEHRALVDEDWLLVMDLDEFLHLHPFPTIQAFLETVGDDVGQIQFPWALVISQAYSHERVLGILDQATCHASDHVKGIVRMACEPAVGIHSHRVAPLETRLSSGLEVSEAPRYPSLLEGTRSFGEHPFLLHFVSRGHLDVMNRILDHQFFNAKSGEKERERLTSFLRGAPSWDNLPTRCLLNRFYASLPRVEPRISIPRLEARTDLRDLRGIFQRLVSRIVVENGELDDIEDRFEERYEYARKLAALDPGRAIRLSDYLACTTQEEYAGRLRGALADDPAR
jgi:hypothetical protein